MDPQQLDVMIGLLADIKECLGWIFAIQVFIMCVLLFSLFFNGLRAGRK